MFQLKKFGKSSCDNYYITKRNILQLAGHISTKSKQNLEKMEEFFPLEVRLITNKIDFDTLLKCQKVSTAFKHFLDNNRDVWLKALDRVRHQHLDVFLSEIPEPTCRYVSATMSPEEVKNDHMSWMVVLEKIKGNGTIEDIILFGKSMKQSKKRIDFFGFFCPIKCLFLFCYGDSNFGYEEFVGYEELAAFSMKLFQTFLRLSLEEEDELISMHFDRMIEHVCRSQNPEVVQYFITKLMRFDPIKTREKEMPFFMHALFDMLQ